MIRHIAVPAVAVCCLKSLGQFLGWSHASLPYANLADRKRVAVRADENADEIKRLMGRYERTVTNNAGTQFRVVKEVFEDYDTVTTFDDVGNVVAAHRSEFKVEKRGPVRVFSFFNSVSTAGPAKGEQNFATHSYIYRADADSFAEVWGLLEGDPTPPRMLIWKRIKAEQ
jgi:hypothetical protein